MNKLINALCACLIIYFVTLCVQTIMVQASTNKINEGYQEEMYRKLYFLTLREKSGIK